MQYRINKENCALLDDLKIESTWDFNKLLNDLLTNYKSDTVRSNIHSIEYNDNLLHVYDMLSLLYKDSQYIVEKIKSKSAWDEHKQNIVLDKESEDINRFTLSDKQLVVYNTRFKEYSALFKLEKTRWTDDKMVESTYVFTPWNNKENKLLRVNLAKLVIDTDLDWTLYMSEKLYKSTLAIFNIIK